MDSRTFYQRRDTIVAAINAWHDKHGSPPRVEDWRGVRDPKFVREHGEGWPSYLTVIRYSPNGTWDGMIEFAGFYPRGRGRPRATDAVDVN